MASEVEVRRATAGDHLQLALYRVVEKVVRLLPPAACHWLGVGLGIGLWAVAPGYRRLIGRNLRIAGGFTGSEPEFARLVRRTFELAGANVIGGARTAAMPLERLRERFEAEGTEHLARAQAEGRGVIQVLAHMGNWELLAQATWLTVPPGMRVGAVYRPLDNPLLDALVRRRRARQGTTLFSRSSGFHQVTSFLRDGHLVGVLSDQRAGRKGLLTPFFGRLSSCSGLPELLARRTNALLVSTSVATIGPGRWRVRYRPIEDPSTAGIMDALASSMSDSLPDVFWLHDRWRIDRTRPLDFYVKRPAVQHPDWITKPFRLLLSCRGLGPEAWITIEEILAARTDVEIDLLDDGTTFIPGPHPRVRRIAFDPSLPTKHLAGQLRRLDRDRPAPLDAAVLLDGDRQLGAACRKAGLRAVVGTTRDPVGPPWTATVLPAADYSLGPFGWRHLAYIVGAVPLVPPS